MYQQRVKKLKKLLKEESCDAIFINDPVNIYYLTGLDLSAGQLLVYSGGTYLIVDGRYLEVCKKKCPFIVRLDSDGKGFEEVLSLKGCSKIKTLGFCSDRLSYQSYLHLKSKLKKFGIIAKALDKPVEEIRSVKDASEIILMKKAARLGSLGFDFVVSKLKEGIKEKELALELEFFWRKKGASKLAFESIIAFGPNSSMPHHKTGERKLKKGDPVLIDIGVYLNGYNSDMTRVVFFGEPKEEIKKIYDIVKTAQQNALDLCKPGIKIGELDKAARDYITTLGYGKNFSHALGHSIGIEIHEYPRVKGAKPDSEVLLKPGMVFTVEPGVYVPKVGGVRLEDTVAITKKGHDNLTNRPKNPKWIS